MGLEISNTKGLSANSLVQDIVQEIKSNRIFFKYLARLFADYKDNNESLIEEIYGQIDRILNSPRLQYNTEKTTLLSNRIKEIYNKDSETFHVIRSEILENTVFYLGPFSIVGNVEYFIEPIIKDQTKPVEVIVGGSDIKCDFVYFYDEGVPLEFVECKADIANVIPRTLPFEKAKSEHRKKVNYLQSAYEYLSENYCPPHIFFACYNLNYEVILNNLQNNWGFKHMSFINAEEIVNGKKRGA